MSQTVNLPTTKPPANQPRRRWVQSGLVTGLGFSLPGLGFAQAGFPNRPMKMIVPWTPGQATDLVGRIAAQEISKALGQAVVVENKAGAGGVIGTDAVAKSAPDGHVLGVVLMIKGGIAAAAGVVLVEEPGRALGTREVADVLGRPVIARIPVRDTIARAVDAGVLPTRIPEPLERGARDALVQVGLHAAEARA